ncbi:MAG: HAD family hydrolase [candidate division Zixibacteria bacterium]|nr:HAD family hydrolase [candidate division Zixibacteria bacterium]
MIYENIEGIIFDMGSTLVEFDSRPWPETMVIGEKYGFDRLIDMGVTMPDIEVFNSRLDLIKTVYRDKAHETNDEWDIAVAFENCLKDLKVANPTENARILSVEFFRAVREIVEPLPGVRDTIEELTDRGLKLGLISNTIFPGDEHDYDLDRFGMKQFLPFRIYSSAFGCRKPRPEIYLEGLKLIDLPAEKVVYVGDRYKEDVLGPQSVGMKGILRYCKIREYPDPMPEGFPVIKQLPELLDIIK